MVYFKHYQTTEQKRQPTENHYFSTKPLVSTVVFHEKNDQEC